MLRGIIPPIPTPLASDETIDLDGLRRLIELNLDAGVHALWVLGTTGRFELLSDAEQRRLAEQAAEIVAGRVPLVLNVSDMGTKRTLERAGLFDDLPYEAYAILPPWYREHTRRELLDYFTRLADELAKPVVIYNAPWVCNMLTFDELRRLAEHPRIVGVKDVTPSLTRCLLWSRAERERLGFSYLHASPFFQLSTELGYDGFVAGLCGLFPELAVTTWDAVADGDIELASRCQTQVMRLSLLFSYGPETACLEAAFRHRGICDCLAAHPQSSLDEAAARKITELLDSVGVLPPVEARTRSS